MKKNLEENYLDKKPKRNESISWTTEDGKITLHIENVGVINRIAQKLFKKPKTSYIHLDEMGSFIWPKMDGEKTIYELGEEVHKEFLEAAEPLYERLVQYFKILESYNFLCWEE